MRESFYLAYQNILLFTLVAGSQNDIDFPHRYVLTLEGRRGSILDVKNDRRQLEGLNFTSHKTAERWLWPGNDLPLYQVKLCHWKTAFAFSLLLRTNNFS